jgi:hypothetical protein
MALTTKMILAKDLEIGNVIVAPFGRKAKVEWLELKRDFLMFKVEGLPRDRMDPYREVFIEVDEAAEKMYLVCANCGEAFDSIDAAVVHESTPSGIDGLLVCDDVDYEIKPESEAM